MSHPSWNSQTLNFFGEQYPLVKTIAFREDPIRLRVREMDKLLARIASDRLVNIGITKTVLGGYLRFTRIETLAKSSPTDGTKTHWTGFTTAIDVTVF